jgi:hypothetical protein
VKNRDKGRKSDVHQNTFGQSVKNIQIAYLLISPIIAPSLMAVKKRAKRKGSKNKSEKINRVKRKQPKTNLALPEFCLQREETVSLNSGWMKFSVKECVICFVRGSYEFDKLVYGGIAKMPTNRCILCA